MKEAAFKARISQRLNARASKAQRKARVTSWMNSLDETDDQDHLRAGEKVRLFRAKAQASGAKVDILLTLGDLAFAIGALLDHHHLAPKVVAGDDPLLRAIPFASLPKPISCLPAPVFDQEICGLSCAAAAIAETGSIVLSSGSKNPTSVSLLPLIHCVVVDGARIVDTLEEGLAFIGASEPARHHAVITGPSRSADIEQKLIFGAHGPRVLHLFVLDRRAN